MAGVLPGAPPALIAAHGSFVTLRHRHVPLWKATVIQTPSALQRTHLLNAMLIAATAVFSSLAGAGQMRTATPGRCVTRLKYAGQLLGTVIRIRFATRTLSTATPILISADQLLDTVLKILTANPGKNAMF